jgi:7-cyano-7-deazaguanine synthase
MYLSHQGVSILMEIKPKTLADLANNTLMGSSVYLSSENKLFDSAVMAQFLKKGEPFVILELSYEKSFSDNGKFMASKVFPKVYEQRISLKSAIKELIDVDCPLENKLGIFLVSYALAVARAEALSAKKLILPISPGFIEKSDLPKLEILLNTLADNGTSKDYKLSIKLMPINENDPKWCESKKWTNQANKQICLVSGGVDSTVAAKIQMTYGKKIDFLQVNYGQSARYQEEWCVNELSKDFGIKTPTKINLSALKYFGGSALLDDSIKITNENLSLEYVPFRNSIFLAFALFKAEISKSSAVILGAHPDDTMAPDGRKVYIDSFNNLLSLFKGYPRVIAPLFDLGGKPELVELGSLMGINWVHTWSCHDFVPLGKAGESCMPCGECSNCITRYSAFKKLGKSDPLSYKTLPKIRTNWAGKAPGMKNALDLINRKAK